MDRWWSLGRRVAWWLGTIAWVVLPVGALIAVSGDDHGTSPAPPHSTWASVGHSTQPSSAPVTMRFRRDAPLDLLAPGMLTGTIQRVEIQPGRSLATGDRVLLVDNVWRVATTLGPFPRPLKLDDAGLDVHDLNDLLRVLSLPSGGTDRYTVATARGVAALAESLGAGRNPQFDPAWTILLPGGVTAISEVHVHPGQSVPSGESIASFGQRLTAVDLGSPDATQGGIATSASRLPKGTQLIVGGTPIGTLPEATTLPTTVTQPEVLVALRLLVPQEDDGTLDGILVSPAPAGSVQVPAAAVYADPNASTCVVWRAADDRPHRAEVHVEDELAEVAQVTGLPDEAVAVQVDPPRGRRRPC